MFAAEAVQEIAVELVLFLENMVQMTLPDVPNESEKKKKRENAKPKATKKASREVTILKRTKFAYPDWVRILENHGDLIDVLKLIGMDEQEADKVSDQITRSKYSSTDIKKINELWEQLYGLILLASYPQMVPPEQDIEKVWRSSARVFAENFCALYQAEDVTPYLHQLVYHVGYYLKTCGSLEELANFAIEGKHRQNKKTIRAACSGQSRKELLNNAQYQQIARTTRMEMLVDKLPNRKKYERATDWKSIGLKKSEWIQKALTHPLVLAEQSLN